MLLHDYTVSFSVQSEIQKSPVLTGQIIGPNELEGNLREHK